MINPLLKQNRKMLTNKDKLYYLVQIILFIISSLLIFNLMYIICNTLGSVVCWTPSEAVVQLKRMLPYILMCIMIIHITIYFRYIYISNNKVNVIKYNGLISIIIATINIIYIVVGLFNNQYAKLIEGYPTFIFPLDIIIISILIIGYNAFLIKYTKKINNTSTNSKCTNIISKVFITLITMFSFASLVYIPFVMDFTKGNIFYNIMFILIHIMALVNFIFYVYIYKNVLDEFKEQVQKDYAGIILFINIIVFAIYMLSVELNPNGPNLNTFGLLPIEFSASLNVFMFIYFICNVIPSLIAYIKSIVF